VHNPGFSFRQFHGDDVRLAVAHNFDTDSDGTWQLLLTSSSWIRDFERDRIEERTKPGALGARRRRKR
jgi:DNA invertase Pin-like site-specific DNA recombinase